MKAKRSLRVIEKKRIGRPPSTRDTVAAVLGIHNDRWLSIRDIAHAVYDSDGPDEVKAASSAIHRFRATLDGTGLRLDCVRMYRLVPDGGAS